MLSAGTVGVTPTVDLLVHLPGTTVPIRLKLESFNPTGSTKDRTAAALLSAMEEKEPLRPGDVVVESTSGNLGLALCRLLALRGCRFVAVVDLNTPLDIRRSLAAAGAELVVVNEPDGHGGYLLNRLRTVGELCARHPGYRWGNQYENPANPAAHFQQTGPELLHQTPDLDTVYVPVSTGGTLAGISRYLRAASPGVRIVAVDAEGSLVTGDRSGKRLLSGIGASRRSSFLTPGTYDEAMRISDADSFALCRLLRVDTGLLVGGSSGSALHACLRDLRGPLPPRRPVCLCPDGGQRYLGTFYDDSWLEHHHILDAVQARMDGLRADGILFERGDT
ncbi:pyridoxal-phosphate dependent enzyme [Micromonospora sp. HUAS LYJ1]|uniref:pyridoxal-phosphate dependent enzyme n=1 Tax=Micromonospora sp. HUAS LYJ1 TaxID=3061626 RepID=UPI00267260A1|nr:pyridoxal-phosphate dependent enzyme [Micromonospora sp. HUAS LYJ1]WKU02938.1 pyridoxal-phosphate dependent enzyme [Micromonospora sp. HUAS LYJ1]